MVAELKAWFKPPARDARGGVWPGQGFNLSWGLAGRLAIGLALALMALGAMPATAAPVLSPVPGLTVQQYCCASSAATVVTVDIRQQPLQLFLKNPKQHYFHSFHAINRLLKPYHQQLIFAMNAGMYHPDFQPVGLYIAHHRQEAPLNTRTGSGNFFMQPNGVFMVSKAGAQVMSTHEFEQLPPAVKHSVELATQSGPLLVHHNQINPRFRPDSASRFIRNAVGINAKGQAVFVITSQPVSLYQLAHFFKYTLHIANALYLDGSVSSLYLPALSRHDQHRALGPIIGIAGPAP